MADVIEDHERSVRPATKDRTIEVQALKHGADVIGPQLRVGVGVAGFLRQSVPSHVHRHQPVAIAKLRVQLTAPGEPALREAVDEYNRTAARVAGLDDVELCPAAARDGVMLHNSNLLV
jgi:hypothetical protein